MPRLCETRNPWGEGTGDDFFIRSWIPLVEAMCYGRFPGAFFFLFHSHLTGARVPVFDEGLLRTAEPWMLRFGTSSVRKHPVCQIDGLASWGLYGESTNLGLTGHQALVNEPFKRGGWLDVVGG